jgi:hypothetical protein
MCEGFVKKIITELRDNPELWEETVVLYSQTETSAPGLLIFLLSGTTLEAHPARSFKAIHDHYRREPGRSVAGLSPGPGNFVFRPPAASPSNRACRFG